ERLEAQLHEGAAALPRVRAIDLVAKSACAPDEGECLAASARKTGFDQMVSAQVAQTPHGYRFHVRAFSARDGALAGEHQGEVRGGPLDLASALELGVCHALGAAPCLGELALSSEEGVAGTRLIVD